MSVITIRQLTDDEIRNLKVIAATNDISMEEYVRKLIRADLSKHGSVIRFLNRGGNYGK